MSLMGKGPLGLKGGKPARDLGYLQKVRSCACYVCGKPAPSEAHHCRDRPDHAEREIYTQMPCAGRTSGDHDAIPLCPEHHRMFHLERPKFHLQFGRDYRMLHSVRALIERMDTIDF